MPCPTCGHRMDCIYSRSEPDVSIDFCPACGTSRTESWDPNGTVVETPDLVMLVRDLLAVFADEADASLVHNFPATVRSMEAASVACFLPVNRPIFRWNPPA